MTAKTYRVATEQFCDLTQKWQGFDEKVRNRLDEICAEARTGVDLLIRHHLSDSGPFGSAMAVISDRFHGVRERIAQGWEKLEKEWEQRADQIESQFGLSPPREEFYALRARYDALDQELTLRLECLQIELQHRYALALLAEAERLKQVVLYCRNCGAQLETAIDWRACQIACQSCSAVNDLVPSQPAILFFQGIGVHACAQAEALNEYLILFHTERSYRRMRLPGESDRQRFFQVLCDYWAAYYRAVGRIDPNFHGDIAGAVQAKLSHYAAVDTGAQARDRQLVDRVFEMATRNDRQGISAALQHSSYGFDDFAIEAKSRGLDALAALFRQLSQQTN